MAMANSFLDPLLGWLLVIHPALAIFILSFIISLIVTLSNKFLTNQKLMKEIKEEQITLQKEMKSHKNNPKKLAKTNSRFMELNLRYMNESMKATLFTLIPFWLVFAWLNSHMGYYPIMPGNHFQVKAIFDENLNNNAKIKLPENLRLNNDVKEKEVKKELTWDIEAIREGISNITIEYNNKEYSKEVLITNKREYLPQEKDFRKCFLFSCTSDGLNKIIIIQEKIIPFKNVPILERIPWISGFGWLGVYILFSLIFSIGLRKIFNVY